MNGKEKTAGEAGWHLSRYNLSASVPGKDSVVIVNLFKGTCAEYSPPELYLLSILERLPETHPIISRFEKRGIVTRIDELSALGTMGRISCGMPLGVSLTICPTMNCNFDCPYCFERHRPGKMSKEVQEDVIGLAERMLDAAVPDKLEVTWFGGEPLLAPDVIENISGRLIELAEKRGIEYIAKIITNGYLLTQENVDMLSRNRVKSCQVTIDGIGAAHNATRHLMGGGPTFDRIINNLRTVKIPFHVHIRQNVSESNKDGVPEVGEFIRRLAEESGNNIDYAPAPVTGNEASQERGGQAELLCKADLSEIGMMRDAAIFTAAHGYFCGANILWSVGIDEEGRLFKCWEIADKYEYLFGNAHDWDPKNPIKTAADPDRLTEYLNTGLPLSDDECNDCVWLPMCAGGCPHKRLTDKKICVPFREQPERYVLALHERIGKKNENKIDD